MKAATATPPISSAIGIRKRSLSSHSVGDRVFHQKFGYGEIMEIEGDKLVIDFDKAGEKKVVAKFVTGASDVPF